MKQSELIRQAANQLLYLANNMFMPIIFNERILSRPCPFDLVFYVLNFLSEHWSLSVSRVCKNNTWLSDEQERIGQTQREREKSCVYSPISRALTGVRDDLGRSGSVRVGSRCPSLIYVQFHFNTSSLNRRAHTHTFPRLNLRVLCPAVSFAFSLERKS